VLLTKDDSETLSESSFFAIDIFLLKLPNDFGFAQKLCAENLHKKVLMRLNKIPPTLFIIEKKKGARLNLTPLNCMNMSSNEC